MVGFGLTYSTILFLAQIFMNSPRKIKLILIVPVLILVAVAALYAVRFFNEKTQIELVTDEPVSEQYSVFDTLAKPYLVPPVKITIQDRNISASIVELGLTDDGFLDTPKRWNEAGWYKKSSKPGETGNVIINAHFDDNLGRPAAFYQLKNVTVGDTVLLEDSLGRLHAYQVVDSFLVDINDPDRLKVLESREEKSELTLITCGGVWLQGRSTYDKRLVVKAELIKSL